MKTHFYCLLFGFFTAVSTVSHAAIFALDFSELAENAPLVPNDGVAYDSWTQSELNYVDPVDGELPFAYGHSVETAPGVFQKGVQLGAYNAIPSGDTLHIERAVGAPLVGTSTSLSFALIRFDLGLDEFGDPYVNPQNTFEIGAYSTSGGNLFSFVAAATIDPTVWNMHYRIGTGSNQLLSNNFALALEQVATMTLSFTGSGADAFFNLSVTTGNTTVTDSGLMTGMATETFDTLRVSMLKVPGTTAGTEDSYGTNSIVIVPEPGSAALLGLAAGLLMLRRRRA
jgi:hypothetical protein